MNPRIVYICPECMRPGVQSTAWIKWDLLTQQWVILNDEPPNSEDYCPHCEQHVKGTCARDATDEEIAEAQARAAV